MVNVNVEPVRKSLKKKKENNNNRITGPTKFFVSRYHNVNIDSHYQRTADSADGTPVVRGRPVARTRTSRRPRRPSPVGHGTARIRGSRHARVSQDGETSSTGPRDARSRRAPPAARYSGRGWHDRFSHTGRHLRPRHDCAFLISRSLPPPPRNHYITLHCTHTHTRTRNPNEHCVRFCVVCSSRSRRHCRSNLPR